MVASYELGGGWMHIDDVKIGKRSFLGNSGMAAPGRKVPKNGLVAVLSAAPDRAKSGSSWLGSPPIRLRRTAAETDTSRTFDPPTRLKVARAVIETLRLIPVMISFGLGIFMLLSLQYIAQQANYVIAGLISGLLLILCGAIACCVAAAAKWAVVGRIEVSEQRTLRRLRGNRCRTVVRERRNRHPDPQPLAAPPRRTDRQGRVVRNLLASRGRPGDSRRGRHR